MHTLSFGVMASGWISAFALSIGSLGIAQRYSDEQHTINKFGEPAHAHQEMALPNGYSLSSCSLFASNQISHAFICLDASKKTVILTVDRVRDLVRALSANSSLTETYNYFEPQEVDQLDFLEYCLIVKRGPENIATRLYKSYQANMQESSNLDYSNITSSNLTLPETTFWECENDNSTVRLAIQSHDTANPAWIKVTIEDFKVIPRATRPAGSLHTVNIDAERWKIVESAPSLISGDNNYLIEQTNKPKEKTKVKLYTPESSAGKITKQDKPKGLLNNHSEEGRTIELLAGVNNEGIQSANPTAHSQAENNEAPTTTDQPRDNKNNRNSPAASTRKTSFRSIEKQIDKNVNLGATALSASTNSSKTGLTLLCLSAPEICKRTKQLTQLANEAPRKSHEVVNWSRSYAIESSKKDGHEANKSVVNVDLNRNDCEDENDPKCDIEEARDEDN